MPKNEVPLLHAGLRNDLSIRVRTDVDEARELVKQASLVSQKGGDLTPRGQPLSS